MKTDERTLPDELARLLPARLVAGIERCGEACEEIRIHRDRETTVTSGGKNHPTGVTLGREEITGLFHRMTGGSLYAVGQTVNRGYLSLPGGIRVGVAGKASLEGDDVIGVSEISGLTVRIPHAVPVPAEPILDRLRTLGGCAGILIYAPPGGGKTTLLRAAARLAASPAHGLRTVVVDTRGELSFGLDGRDLSLDLLIGYPKGLGIRIAVQSLGAQLVVCDEIGDGTDADAILSAANCGVPLIASAHAGSAEELLRRPYLRRLSDAGVFGCYVGISRGESGAVRYRFTDREEATVP